MHVNFGITESSRSMVNCGINWSVRHLEIQMSQMVLLIKGLKIKFLSYYTILDSIVSIQLRWQPLKPNYLNFGITESSRSMVNCGINWSVGHLEILLIKCLKIKFLSYYTILDSMVSIQLKWQPLKPKYLIFWVPHTNTNKCVPLFCITLHHILITFLYVPLFGILPIHEVYIGSITTLIPNKRSNCRQI